VLVTLANNWISFATHNYQAELFPTRVRARAVGFVYSWSRVSAALAGLLIGFFLRAGRHAGGGAVHRRGHGGDGDHHWRFRAGYPWPQPGRDFPLILRLLRVTPRST
jgi:MFS family permease